MCWYEKATIKTLKWLDQDGGGVGGGRQQVFSMTEV